MLDEEREALEILNNTEWDGFMITIKNLIKKQSKEIKELKENNRKYIVQLTDEQYRNLVDIIRNDINKEWIDKINLKIEELDETKQYWNNEVIKILNDIKGDDK